MCCLLNLPILISLRGESRTSKATKMEIFAGIFSLTCRKLMEPSRTFQDNLHFKMVDLRMINF